MNFSLSCRGGGLTKKLVWHMSAILAVFVPVFILAVFVPVFLWRVLHPLTGPRDCSLSCVVGWLSSGCFFLQVVEAVVYWSVLAWE